MHASRALPTLIAIGCLLVLAPTAQALTIHAEDGDRVGSVQAPPGEPLHIHGEGTVTIDGPLATQAAERPGSNGPDIHITLEGPLILTEEASILAADGRRALDVSGTGTVHARNGGQGGNVEIEADRILSQGARIASGNGGHGGNATATGNPHAVAHAGDGEEAGQLLVRAPVTGELLRDPGDGGNGGHANAKGQDGQDCTGEDGSSEETNRSEELPNADGSGQDANATAEHGACGPVDGQGGQGGNAKAYGGDGATAPNGTGGDGGDADAIGGRGGDGMDACFDTREAAEASGITHAGHGGPGGGALAVGGDGGPGVNGGAGGDAFGREQGGDGGNATNPPIRPGTGGANHAPGVPAGGKGGDGGVGGVNGGAGGSAVWVTSTGSGGSVCDGDSYSHAMERSPGPGAYAVGVLLVASILLGRRD